MLADIHSLQNYNMVLLKIYVSKFSAKPDIMMISFMISERRFLWGTFCPLLLSGDRTGKIKAS